LFLPVLPFIPSHARLSKEEMKTWMTSQYVHIHICFGCIAFVSYFNTELAYKTSLQTKISLQNSQVCM